MRADGICESCDKPLPAGADRFCSKRCQSRQYYHEVVKPAVAAARAGQQKRRCEKCRKEMSSTHGNRRFCSKDCSNAASYQLRKARPVSPKVLASYWSQVAVAGPDDCWGWKGRLDKDGYGLVSTGSGDTHAHRLGWRIAHGMEKLSRSDIIRHSCDNRPCNNPSHLIKGTTADNVADMLAKGRISWGEGRPASKLTLDVVQAIAREYAAGGVSQQELADRYEVSRAVVGGILRGETWTRVEKADTTAALAARKKEQPYHVRGGGHPLSKLTEETVKHIRSRYAAGGVTMQELADEVGVDRTNVSSIIRRKTWTHLD